MYPEADYSLYKFARTRHGFWFWFIHGMVLVFVGVLPFTDQFHWGLIPMSLAIELIYWIGNYRHRDRLRKMNEKGPGSPHKKTVCENCNPPCYRSKDPEVDGSPLTDIEDWYMAAYHVDRERAQREIANARFTGEIAVLSALHTKYLMHHKFDKFLRK